MHYWSFLFDDYWCFLIDAWWLFSPDANKNKDDEKYVDFGTSLKAVILGQNFSQKKKLELPQNVSQFQINWECGCPNLWFENTTRK